MGAGSGVAGCGTGAADARGSASDIASVAFGFSVAGGAGFACRAAAASGAAAAGAALAAAAAVSSVPTTAPMATVSPSGTLMARIPSSSATTSRVTLSVSMTKSGSSFFTGSPSFLNHWASSASVTDSPTLGTFISISINTP